MGRSGGGGGLLPTRGGSDPTLFGGGGAADGLKLPLPGLPEGGSGGRGPKHMHTDDRTDSEIQNTRTDKML